MSGEKDLTQLIKNMNPELRDGEFVFASLDRKDVKSKGLNPVFTFIEDEGLSLIIRQMDAEINNIPYDSVFKMITLNIHSSLNAVGFFAVILNELAKQNISVNPVSAFYHDHLFIPKEKAETAMVVLRKITI